MTARSSLGCFSNNRQLSVRIWYLPLSSFVLCKALLSAKSCSVTVRREATRDYKTALVQEGFRYILAGCYLCARISPLKVFKGQTR